MEIVGLAEKPQPEDIKGLFLHSDVAQNGRFSSSSDLLNPIQEAAERTFLANLVSVQSDCPARVDLGRNPSPKIEIRSRQSDFDPEKLEGLETGQFELEGGDYVISVLR